MTHRERHPEPQPDCFGCKLQSINWGIVPGAFRDTNSTTMFDRDAALEQLGHRDGRGSAMSKERVMDARSDVTSRIGDFLAAD
jgi:hypothetical protein